MGSGEAAIALLESLMASMEQRGMLSSEEIMQVYDGALQRIHARPDTNAVESASELLRDCLRKRVADAG